MSIQELHLQKPASEMTPEEWEELKATVDARVREQGREPVDWSRIAQPRTSTEADMAWAQEVLKKYDLMPA
jgi:hypothetical protein